ncbi:MAG: OmpA family protein [Betaproteobacteria bacterium]|nr:MAG: OmpA family protein [Betaproteobacteria bacterium]
MIRNVWTMFVAAAGLALSATPFSATAQGETSGYVMSPSTGAAVRSASGCVRTSYWSPSLATMECDPDLVPKPAAAPAPAPAPQAAPPAAAPAPVPAPAPKPAAKPKPVAEKITFAADVLFDFDKATIKPEGKAKLDELAAKVKDINLEVVIAIGHTDSIGADAYNQKLSVRRAESVKAYMVSKGIQPNRVYTEGKGEKQPIASNATKDGRQKNRRVEIEVIGTRK